MPYKIPQNRTTVKTIKMKVRGPVRVISDTNADYLTAYLAGCSFYSLTSHQKEWNKGTFARGVNEVLKLYDSSKHVLGENENLEKLLELFISEGDGFKNFIEENYNK